MGFPTIVQYWRSFEHLEAFARDPGDLHRPAWLDWYRRDRNGRTGIWHETFLVRAGEYEAILTDVPARGSRPVRRSAPLSGGSSARGAAGPDAPSRQSPRRGGRAVVTCARLLSGADRPATAAGQARDAACHGTARSCHIDARGRQARHDRVTCLTRAGSRAWVLGGRSSSRRGKAALRRVHVESQALDALPGSWSTAGPERRRYRSSAKAVADSSCVRCEVLRLRDYQHHLGPRYDPPVWAVCSDAAPYPSGLFSAGSAARLRGRAGLPVRGGSCTTSTYTRVGEGSIEDWPACSAEAELAAQLGDVAGGLDVVRRASRCAPRRRRRTSSGSRRRPPCRRASSARTRRRRAAPSCPGPRPG